VVDPDSRRTWAARLVAPAAFFAAATVLVILIESGLHGGESATIESTPAVVTPTTAESTTTTAKKKKKKIYRVKRGDTLESIAAKFHTTVDDLLQLNPNVDPLALTPGQRIRVS
jgi:LysM repeat protein